MSKVLIVEDDESMAVALRAGFKSEGFEVELATDGATGLSATILDHSRWIASDGRLGQTAPASAGR